MKLGLDIRLKTELDNSLDCCDNASARVESETRVERIKDAQTDEIVVDEPRTVCIGQCEECFTDFRFVYHRTTGSRIYSLITCDNCYGIGQMDEGNLFGITDCRKCNGSGWKHRQVWKATKHWFYHTFGCSTCGGSGTIIDHYSHPPVDVTCTVCKGRPFTHRTIINGILNTVR